MNTKPLVLAWALLWCNIFALYRAFSKAPGKMCGKLALGFACFFVLIPIIISTIWGIRNSEYMPKGTVPQNSWEDARLNSLGNRIMDASGNSRNNLRFLVYANDEINSFLISPELITVSSAAVKELTDDELASMLAHELGHRKLSVKDGKLVWGTFWRKAAEQISGALAFVIGKKNAYAFLEWWIDVTDAAHSRWSERQADREGFEILVTAGFHPHGMVSTFERRQAAYPAESKVDSSDPQGWKAMYPPIGERIKMAEDLEQSWRSSVGGE